MRIITKHSINLLTIKSGMKVINNVTVLECCRVAPPATSVSEMSHSLSFSDMIWIGSSPTQKLLFYETHVSKNHFTQTIIPELKNSLSLALKHFPSLAGNLIIHSDHSRKPEIRFTNGDSISLVFAESSFQDFELLVSNQPRNCREFYPLVPELPKSSKSGEETMVPLFAIQVTLFPGNGVSVGISNNHVAGDGSSMLAFLKTWATISKLGEDYEKLRSVDELLAIYDRGLLRDQTKKLDDMVWKKMTSDKINEMDMDDIQVYLPQETEKVRSTFVVGLKESERLKRMLLDCSSMKHLSTFTVICGYVWTCMVKAENAVKRVEEKEIDFFSCAADFRVRLHPPIPTNYFGNCQVACETNVRSGELISHGGDGFATAAKLIGEAIHNTVEKKEEIFERVEKVLLEKMVDNDPVINRSRVLGISGSPRQNYYILDFGWGNPRKYEFISIDLTGAISLGGCRDDSKGIEIGVALPKNKMNAFVKYFKEGLACRICKRLN